MANVKIENICKSFASTKVLENVSLDIKDGEFISLVGPSGCGKSTLLRIIAGLEQQDKGNITLDEQVINNSRAADRNLSMVFQSYALYPHLSVAENIAVPLKMREMSFLQRLPLIGPFMSGHRDVAKHIGQSVEDVANTLQIQHLLDRKPGQLSGGQRQRVAVGRALVRKPKAFLLDEPLSNLDAKLRVHTRAEIAQLHRSLKATFIYVTHDQVEAMTMSDRIAVMMDGEILQVGTPEEIYNAPCDLRVAEFIGLPKMTILPAEANHLGELIILGDNTGIKLEIKSQFLSIGIRPEHLAIRKSKGIFSGFLKHIENLGSEVYLHLSVEDIEQPIITRITPQESKSLKLNSKIDLAFNIDDLHLFSENGKRFNFVPTASKKRKARV